MKPILVLDGARDVIAVLIIRNKVAGAWRADALPWVLEAFKPLAKAQLLNVVLRSRKSVRLWNRTKTAQEIFDELSAPVVLLARNLYGHWLNQNPTAQRMVDEPEDDAQRMKNRLMVAYIAGFTAGWTNAKSK